MSSMYGTIRGSRGESTRNAPGDIPGTIVIGGTQGDALKHAAERLRSVVRQWPGEPAALYRDNDGDLTLAMHLATIAECERRGYHLLQRYTPAQS